jgi:hypothetical protein
MVNNKKVKNATPLVYKDIHFKSKLEVSMYKILEAEGFNVKYEPKTFVIWKGFKPTVPFYDKNKKTRMLKFNKTKLIDITYTPDFVFLYNNKWIIIEAKGRENDVFPLKKKMFRKCLEDEFPNSIFFEVFTLKQLRQAIEIIKHG